MTSVPPGGAAAVAPTTPIRRVLARRVSRARVSRQVLAVVQTMRLTLDHAESAARSARPERGAAYITATIDDLSRELARLRTIAAQAQ